MATTPNTFIVSPIRYGATLASRPKTALMKIEELLAAGPVSTPSPSDKIGLWTCLQEWANRNVAALEGTRAGHAGRAGAGGAGGENLVGGDSEDDD
jgi:hypothetical protein